MQHLIHQIKKECPKCGGKGDVIISGTDAETQLDYLSVATKGLGKVYS